MSLYVLSGFTTSLQKKRKKLYINSTHRYTYACIIYLENSWHCITTTAIAAKSNRQQTNKYINTCALGWPKGLEEFYAI